MSTPMRCLLDKAAARRIREALFRLASAKELTVEEIHALGLYERAGFPGMRLFIVPPTDNVLKRLALIAAYAPLIAFFVQGQKRLAAMRPHLRPTYRSAALPAVKRPEHIPEESLSGVQRLHEETASYEV